MESNLMQVVQNDGISAEHGYSKNSEVQSQSESAKSSSEMSLSGAASEQQDQPLPPKVVSSKKKERASPAKAPMKDLSKINPQQLASWLLNEQKKKNAMPKTPNSISKLQQQLQGSPNSSVQHNVVSSSGGTITTIVQKDAGQSSSGHRKVQRVIIPAGQPAVCTRPSLPQGILHQNVIFNNNQPQRFQTIGSPQSIIPSPLKQASPNVRLIGRQPISNTPILPRGVNVSSLNPRTLTPIAPKQSAGKQSIPANCVQGSRLAIPVQSNTQLQPNSNSETFLLVSQADGNQVVTVAPHTPGNQVFYTMSKGPQPIIVKQQQHVVVTPGTSGRKTQRIIHLGKNQPGVIAQPRQLLAIRQPAAAASVNGVKVKGNEQTDQEEPPEGQGDEEEEEEEEGGEQNMEALQNCPTLAEEQRLLSMNQLNADNVKGGGNKKIVEPKHLKGNATGLHMIRPQEASPASVSGRNWQYSTEGKELRRPPLRPESAQSPMQTGENNSNNQTETIRKLPTEPNKYAVCSFCGQMSQDYTQCDYCRRQLPADIKFYYPKGEQPESVKLPVASKENEDAKATIEAAQFYTKTTPRILARGKRSGKTVKRKKTEPEMVTISSDEEEDEEGGEMSSAQSLLVAGKGLVVGQQPPTGNQAQVIQQQLIPMNNSQVVVNSLTRRQRMEDQKGNVVKKPGRKKKKLTPAEQVKVLEQLAGPDDEDMLPEIVALDARGIRIGSLRGSTYTPVLFADTGITLGIECRELTVGELVIEVRDLIKVLYHLGMKMPCIFLQTTPECTNRIRLKCGMDKMNTNLYYDPMSPDESQKLICIILAPLNQEEKDKLNCMFEHYDAVTHVRHNLVEHVDYNTANVLLAKSSGAKNQIMVSGFLPIAPGDSSGASVKVFTVNSIAGFPATAQLLQHNYTGEESDMDEDEDDEPQDRSRSPSPPLSVFAGPIVKLYTFPPPPATGGIPVTNEDLFCLNEGEFLNDVIIDFYLKYLYLNNLEDHERQKTHIFSSFFYRRLTQKAKRVAEEGETPQQKRHNRVKTWTRHVDLFKKDFIIVPINENAHWYLAIICFPWMLKPEKLNVITHEVNPTLAAMCENNEDNNKVDQQQTTPPAAAAESSIGDATGDAASVAASAEDPKKTSDEVKANGDEPKTEDLDVEMKETEKETTEGKVSPDKANGEHSSTEEKMKSEDTVKESAQDKEKETVEAEAKQEKVTESQETKEASSSQDSVAPKDTKLNVVGTSMKTVTRQACILLFDSLAGPNRSSVVRTLREYLQVEWDVKKTKTEGSRVFDKETIKGGNPRCPQQTNYSDCGVYLLQYVESFFEDPVQDYSIPMKALENWFPEERVRCKREELRELLLELKTKLNPNLEYDCSKDILS